MSVSYLSTLILYFLWQVLYPVGVSSEKPNIVLIVADDLGFNDVGFHGSDVRTPNIDALAGHGIILNRHYTLPCCTPSRAALMTAKYPIRTGMHGMPIRNSAAKGLPLDEKIFPEYFNDLGYKSHLIGKWHLGFMSRPYIPTMRGFDSFYGYWGGVIGYYDAVFSQNGMSGRDFRRDEEPIWEEVYGKYMTEVLTKEAVSVIKKHEKKTGLLLVLTHLAPHKGNLNILREAPPNTANFTERGVYVEMVRRLDDSVGEVVSALNDKGILNNTIIVFMSDNGAPTADYLYGYENHGSNWPLKGLKLSSHEGGVRTPALIWSPLLNKSRISTDLFHITDWLPTLYTAAGGNSKTFKTKDGISHWHSFISGSSGPRNEVLINMDPAFKNDAIIKGKWKLVRGFAQNSPTGYLDRYYGEPGRREQYEPVEVETSLVGSILGCPKVPYDEVLQRARISETCPDQASAESADCFKKYCLFDIVADQLECRDLSSEFPLVVSDLKTRLDSFRGLVVPAENNTSVPRSNPIYWDDYWSPWLSSGAWKSSSSIFVFASIIGLKLGLQIF